MPNPNLGRQVAYEIFDNDYETFCTRVDYVDFGDPARAARANASTDALLGEIQAVGGRLCPGVEGGATVLPSPLEVALSYKEQVVLPDPAPEIAPGWAITGLPAYLESNGRQAADFPFQTVLGTLEVRATFSHLVVDWADGRGPQRYDDLGGPYPRGEVSTVYVDTGVVDVHVRQYWDVTWSVGGATGEFLDMYSEAVIPAFEVEQVQAVLE